LQKIPRRVDARGARGNVSGKRKRQQKERMDYAVFAVISSVCAFVADACIRFGCGNGTVFQDVVAYADDGHFID
jgi:hypothetical protein